MPEIGINQTSLYYEAIGSGTPALLMHGGLGFDHTSYRPDFDRLAGRLRLVYYDHRCNGRSGRPSLDTLTMQQLADDADALAQALAMPRVVVIGHSYGGFVAQELAIRHPARVAALVLIDTTPGQLGTGERPEDSAGPPPPAELEAMMADPPQTDEALAAAMPKLAPAYLHRAGASVLIDRAKDMIFSAAAMGRSMQVLQEWSSVDRLHTVGAPALLMVGSHDRLTAPPQSHRIARRLKRAEMVEFAHSAHFPWLEEPERFFDVLESWLDRTLSPAG